MIVATSEEEELMTDVEPLLGQLDFEIERLSSTATKTGLTQWTLLAAARMSRLALRSS